MELLLVEEKTYEDLNERVLRHVGNGYRIPNVDYGTGTLELKIKYSTMS